MSASELPLADLAEFTLDVWLIARFSPQLGGPLLDGRTWERAISGLLHRPGFVRRQGPGSLTLFGATSASGAAHEIDGAGGSLRGSFVIECKARTGGMTKADVALFHSKIMDFYQKQIVAASRDRWWGFLCSTVPTASPVRAMALNLGLLVCDPERLPLPVLMRAASRPGADMHLPETLLREIVRLGERALCALQERWRYNGSAREIGFKLGHWRDGEIQDLLWLEDELTGHLLDLYEQRRPGALERRAKPLIWQMQKVA